MTETQTDKATGKLVFYWVIVGIPLAWGIYNTLKRVMLLFT